MPGITFTEEAIIANGRLEAAWYPCEIKKVIAGPGKSTPGSTTWRIELVVKSGPGEGTPVTHFINDGSPGALKMTRAFAYVGAFVEKIEAGKEVPIEATEGRQIMAYIAFDPGDNNNRCLDFKKM